MLSSLRWITLFSMPKAAGMQLLLRIQNSPGALALGERTDFDDDSVCPAGLSIEELGDLSNDQRERSEPGRLGQSHVSKMITIPLKALKRLQ
jgi:hypothetical protein